MSNTNKKYGVDFYIDNIFYFLKGNKLNKVYGANLLGGSKYFSNGDEVLEFIEKSLEEKFSKFIVTEQNLDFLEEIGVDVNELDVKRVIIFKQKSMQLVLNDKAGIDVYDIKGSQYKTIEKNFEKILNQTIDCQYEVEQDIKIAFKWY